MRPERSFSLVSARRLRTAALLAVAAVAAPLAAQTVAITGGTVYPVSGPKIDHATVLIRDGRIAAVGPDLPVPDGATRVDATGKWVTPGLIHAGTTLGTHVFDIGAQEETQEDIVLGDVKAAFNVADGIDPRSITIPVARAEGITTALTMPQQGLIPGQAVVIDLAGNRLDDLLVKSPAAMIADLGQGGKASGGGSRAGSLLRLRLVLRDAKEYAQRRQDFRKAQMQPLAAPEPDLEALQPVLNGELPLLVIANRRSDIESALRIAREFKLRLLIWGGTEAWQIAGDLAAAHIPVILEPLSDVPRFDGLAARLDNATLLEQQGVTVVAAQRDLAHFRDLRGAAGNEVRNGLTWDAALRTVTLAAAEALGIADRYGSLEPGKTGNVVVWSGDPFEFASRAEHVFIRGVEVPLTNRQTELFERYRHLPPAW
jgi:imidazolonepropionase-like amidohydrolase